MKILVVCQYYWPEPFRLDDICEELVSRGHEVSVLTGVPNYPLGDIYSGYRRGKNRRQVKDGVNIIRTFTIGRKRNIFFRVLNYYSFSLSSRSYVRKLDGDFDVVLAYQASPVMMSRAAIRYGKKHGKKVLLYCMDLWPSSLRAGGIEPGTAVYRAFHKVSADIYYGVDRIAVSSPGFLGYLGDTFGISREKMTYLPQYAYEAFELPPKEREEGLELVFAGNLGKAQDLGTVIGAAELLRHKKNIRWSLVGDGSCREALEADVRARGLDNVVFHGFLSGEALKNAYARADAMLMTLTSDPVISLTLPQKLMSYMGSGRPIIAALDGSAADEIRNAGCGFVVPAGDSEALARAVLDFEACDDRSVFCNAARAYYGNWFGRDRFMDELESLLLRLCRGEEE